MKSFELQLEIKAVAATHKIYVNRVTKEKPVIIFKRNSDHSINFRVKSLDIKKVSLQDKTIFRYPKLSLPRQKVDVLKEKYNLSVVRTSDTADYKIISEDYVNSLLDRKWSESIMFDKFIEYYKSTSLHWDTKSVEDAIKSIQDQVDLEDKVAISIRSNMAWNFHNTSAYDVSREMPWIEDKVLYISDESTLKAILSSDNLIYDTALSGVTVEDSIILGEKEYESLLSMINSKDKENVNLALEMMANCNVEKSFDIIALIFYMNHAILKDFSTNWTSINIKTLRKRFNEFIPYGNYNVHYFDRLLKNLVSENALTEFAFKIVSIKMLDYLTHSMGFNDESVFDLKLEDIKLKPHFYEKLKLNDKGVKIIDTQTYLPF